MGNLLSKMEGSSTTSLNGYGSGAPRHAPRTISAGGIITPTYDSTGNLLKARGASSIDLDYDAENHLIRYLDNVSEASTTFAYDADGQLTRRTVEQKDGITSTLYLGNSVEIVAEAANLARNGGFESGLADWTPAGTVSQAPFVQSTYKHSGSQAVQIGVDQPGDTVTWSSLSQDISIAPPATPSNLPSVVVTFWYSATVSTTYATEQYVKASVLQGGQEEQLMLKADPDITGWRRFSYNLHRRYNGQTITLRFEVSSTNNLKRAFMQVDDVQVKACATELCNGDFEYGLYGWTPGGTIMPKSLVLSRRTGAYGPRRQQGPATAGGLQQALPAADHHRHPGGPERHRQVLVLPGRQYHGHEPQPSDGLRRREQLHQCGGPANAVDQGRQR